MGCLWHSLGNNDEAIKFFDKACAMETEEELYAIEISYKKPKDISDANVDRSGRFLNYARVVIK